jgi:hypothetical protein
LSKTIYGVEDPSHECQQTFDAFGKQFAIKKLKEKGATNREEANGEECAFPYKDKGRRKACKIMQGIPNQCTLFNN